MYTAINSSCYPCIHAAHDTCSSVIIQSKSDSLSSPSFAVTRTHKHNAQSTLALRKLCWVNGVALTCTFLASNLGFASVAYVARAVLGVLVANMATKSEWLEWRASPNAPSVQISDRLSLISPMTNGAQMLRTYDYPTTPAVEATAVPIIQRSGTKTPQYESIINWTNWTSCWMAPSMPNEFPVARLATALHVNKNSAQYYIYSLSCPSILGIIICTYLLLDCTVW